MTNRNRKRLIAIALALFIPLVALPFIGAPILGMVMTTFAPKYSATFEGKVIMLLASYIDRNNAAVTYFDRGRKDATTADELRKYADEAKTLGEAIRKNLMDPNPPDAARATFERYIAVQCTIARKAESAMNKSQPWIQASYYRESFNKAAHGEMTTYERIFGSKRLLMRDCGQQ